MTLPNTAKRVRAVSPSSANRRIEQDIAASLDWHAKHPDHIDQRLRELDEEWDIERTLEVNAAALALTGTLLGIFLDRRFLAGSSDGISLAARSPGLVPAGAAAPQDWRAHDARDRH